MTPDEEYEFYAKPENHEPQSLVVPGRPYRPDLSLEARIEQVTQVLHPDAPIVKLLNEALNELRIREESVETLQMELENRDDDQADQLQQIGWFNPGSGNLHRMKPDHYNPTDHREWERVYLWMGD